MIPYYQPPSLTLGPFTVEVFGVFAGAGILLAAWIAAKRAARDGLDPTILSDWAIWGVLSGVLVGHLVHVGLYHPEELRSLSKVLRVWDGLSSFGGLLGGLVSAVIYFRWRGVAMLRYGDAFALGVAPGWAVGRLGCFAVHDHPGVRTNFFLAVAFPGTTWASTTRWSSSRSPPSCTPWRAEGRSRTGCSRSWRSCTACLGSSWTFFARATSRTATPVTRA